MKRQMIVVMVLISNLAADKYDPIERQWLVPEMTPIIETISGGDPDPFDPEPLVTFQIFEKTEIKRWLQTQGVYFPPGGSASYVQKKNGEHRLIVKTRPSEFSLVEGILEVTYPVHTSRQLLMKFLAETKGKKIAELPLIIQKYPAQALGPLQNVVEELAKLDRQLEVNPDNKLRKTVTKRRDRILKMLPESIKATRTYFETMTKIMAE